MPHFPGYRLPDELSALRDQIKRVVRDEIIPVEQRIEVVPAGQAHGGPEGGRQRRVVHEQVGIVVQAYLKDGERDLARLLAWRNKRGARFGIRLVKGAYLEPPNLAFPDRRAVDASLGSASRSQARDRQAGAARCSQAAAPRR